MKTYKPSDIVARFSHIDGERLTCQLGIGISELFLKIPFYPWWEHPKYLEAVSKNRKWSFQDVDEGSKEMTILPKDLLEFRISQQFEITDIDFPKSHPILWNHQDQGAIFVNSAVDWGAFTKDILEKLGHYFDEEDLFRILGPAKKSSSPFSIPYIPAEVFPLVVGSLDNLKVKYLISRRPENRSTPILFLMNGEDYVVARDFDILVPEFEHKSEWYTGE